MCNVFFLLLRPNTQPEANPMRFSLQERCGERLLIPPRRRRLTQHARKNTGMAQRRENGLKSTQAESAKKEPLKVPYLLRDPVGKLLGDKRCEAHIAGVIEVALGCGHTRHKDTAHRQRSRLLRVANKLRSLQAISIELTIQKEKTVRGGVRWGRMHPHRARSGEPRALDFLYGAHLGAWRSCQALR